MLQIRAQFFGMVLLIAGWGFPAFAQPTNQNRFGFTGPEIFPIDFQISHLRAADLNGDGKPDLIVANNSRSKISLLINRTGETNLQKTASRELNELAPDSRFRLDSVASEKRISSLVVADLNGDGRPDLAYYGEPKELVVQYNEGTNGWSALKRWAIEDGELTPNALVAGDLNGDHRTDLILLGESSIYFLSQNTNHALSDPEKIPFSGTVKSVQILDIDGDSRDDLLLVNWESPNPFRFRLQAEDGHLGPELHFALPPIRSYAADDLDQDGKTEVVTIAQNSGRAQISNFASRPADPLSGAFRQGQFYVLPLNKTAKARRGTLWADINGDHLDDLVVAEPDSGQLTVYLQRTNGTLAGARTFPTFTGVSEIAAGDWDGDGMAELFVLSADERQIGVSRMDRNGRIPFPTLVALEGKPLSMAVGKLLPNAGAVLAVILDLETNRVLTIIGADGQTKSQKLADSFKANPTSIVFHDVNQDGLADLVLLIPYEKIKILLQQAGGRFEEQDIAPPGGNTELPWLSAVDVDGDGKPELLLAQKNFLRAVVLKSEGQSKGTNRVSWSFTVKEQINGASGNSKIVGAAPLLNGTNRIASLFLLDSERKALTLSERDTAGVWQVVRNIPLPFYDFTELRPVNIGGKMSNSVGFSGLSAIGWMRLDGASWEFSELDSYETPIKDGRLTDVIPGDLNHDGRKDLVFLETGKNYVDLVTFEAPHKLVPANRWQVFEERTFRSRRSDLPEPREAVIADVTGDGKNDLIVLVHDRILLYPQD